ncbi:unnamed protein product, partial [Didymodactylos carnosus]
QTLRSELETLNIQEASESPVKVPRTESEIEQYEMLKTQLETCLAEYDISIKEEFEQLVIQKKQEVESLKKEGKHKDAQKRQNSLSELEIELLFDRIEAMKPSHSSVSNENPEKKSKNDHLDDDSSKEFEKKEIVEMVSCRVEERSITEENLKNMQKDFSSMPFCSERFIICLLYYISLKLVGDTIVSDDSIKVPDRIETEIEKEFEHLRERLKIEELESKEIRNLVETAFINVKNDKWKVALITLKKLLERISPLDMGEFPGFGDTGVFEKRKFANRRLNSYFFACCHRITAEKSRLVIILRQNHDKLCNIDEPIIVKVFLQPLRRQKRNFKKMFKNELTEDLDKKIKEIWDTIDKAYNNERIKGERLNKNTKLTRNILLLGRTRSGKTTMKNMLKDPRHISDGLTLYSQTKYPTLNQIKIDDHNMQLNIIDTPGLFDRQLLKNKDILNLIDKFLSEEQISKKLHLICFCVSFESGINEDDIQSIKTFIDHFGFDIAKNSCFIVTRSESKSNEQREKLHDEIMNDQHFKEWLPFKWSV